MDKVEENISKEKEIGDVKDSEWDRVKRNIKKMEEEMCEEKIKKKKN